MSSTDRGIKTSISQSGFRPQLFTVVGGSYVSNPPVYGSGATLLNDYNDEIISTKSFAKIRKEDTNVEFNIKIVIDLSLVDPAHPATEELRIRTSQPLASGEPARYRNALPVPSSKFNLPLFNDIEFIDSTTGLQLATGAIPAGKIQARMLYGGELALIVTDFSAGPPPTVTPMDAGDLAAAFGAAAGTELIISIRGTYRA